MEPPNTYTCQQSQLPPMTDAIQSEIAKVDFHVSNTISELKGNYYGLLKLAEVLADLLNSAETNLHSIRIIPDSCEPELPPKAIGFTDLPTREKQLLISTAITSTVAIKMVATMIGCSFSDAAAHVSRESESQLERMSSEQIEEAVARLARELHKQPDGTFFTF